MFLIPSYFESSVTNEQVALRFRAGVLVYYFRDPHPNSDSTLGRFYAFTPQ